MPTTVTRATTRPTPDPPAPGLADELVAWAEALRAVHGAGSAGAALIDRATAELRRLRAEVARLRAELARLAEYCAYLGDSGHVSPGRTVELSARVRDAWAVLGEGGGGQGG